MMLILDKKFGLNLEFNQGQHRRHVRLSRIPQNNFAIAHWGVLVLDMDQFVQSITVPPVGDGFIVGTQTR